MEKTNTKSLTKKPELSIAEYVNQPSVKEGIEKTLGARMPQFITSVISLVNTNNTLAACDRPSLLRACLVAASLDLPINQNLGFAYVIPYGDKAQFQMGYKGFIQLAQRSGQFKALNVSDVREGEIKKIDRLTGEIKFQWAQEGRDELPVIGYVGHFKLLNGFQKTMYMTVEELKAHGLKYSQVYKRTGKGLWTEDFDAMASKTVIKLLLSKYAPMTVDMQQAALADQAIIGDNDQYDYVDNEPVAAAQVAKEKEKARLIKAIEQSTSFEQLDALQEFIVDEDVQKLYNEKYESLVNAAEEAEAKKHDEEVQEGQP